MPLGQLLERIAKTQYEAIPVIAMVADRRYENEKANKSAKTTMPTISLVKATKFNHLEKRLIASALYTQRTLSPL